MDREVDLGEVGVRNGYEKKTMYQILQELLLKCGANIEANDALFFGSGDLRVLSTFIINIHFGAGLD